MPVPQVIVLRAPGTNCDLETAYAFERCGAVAERMHLFRLLEQPALLKGFQILCIPGGFSYGDDVGAGVIFGSHLRSHLGEALREFLQEDRLVLGICNGFQVLMRSGILPDGGENWPPRDGQQPSATLTWNDNGKYTARWVRLRTAGSNSVFLKGIEGLELPIAHAEGRIAVRSPEVVNTWREKQQVALCYDRLQPSAESNGSQSDTPLPYPDNPNGSIANIAGLCDPTGRVLGLMPHPERHIHATQHPQWTRNGLQTDEGAGLQLFRNAVEYFQ